MTGPRALVLAKAPVAGRVKTRLGHDIGMDVAAGIAAAALADTLAACTAAFGADRCHLALDGDLATAVDGAGLQQQLVGWSVAPQRGDGFAARLANAHLEVADGPVVQIGMDTPQVTPSLLADAAAPLGSHDAVLGPADDGGWWVLALRDPRAAAVLAEVEMSTPRTYDDTLAALEARGLSVAVTSSLRDVDTVDDAEAVAAAAPDTRFARAWEARR